MHLGIIKIIYNRRATHFMDDSFVNLGEEVILTLLWQSGASESATVCFVISLSIYCSNAEFEKKKIKYYNYMKSILFPNLFSIFIFLYSILMVKLNCINQKASLINCFYILKCNFLIYL